jgi:hypothetical protein
MRRELCARKKQQRTVIFLGFTKMFSTEIQLVNKHMGMSALFATKGMQKKATRSSTPVGDQLQERPVRVL